MKLKQILDNFDYIVENGSVDTEICHLVMDSRKVEPGDVFVCISGAVTDGHDYVEEVIEKGAVAVIVEREVPFRGEVTVVKTENTRYALACMSAAYFGHPAQKLKTIGITGTKGKTTTTYMVRSVLEGVGIKTGLIGTIETIIGEKRIPSRNTIVRFWMERYFVLRSW